MGAQHRVEPCNARGAVVGGKRVRQRDPVGPEVVAERDDGVGQPARVGADQPDPAERGQADAEHRAVGRAERRGAIGRAVQAGDGRGQPPPCLDDVPVAAQHEADIAPFGVEMIVERTARVGEIIGRHERSQVGVRHVEQNDRRRGRHRSHPSSLSCRDYGAQRRRSPLISPVTIICLFLTPRAAGAASPPPRRRPSGPAVRA